MPRARRGPDGEMEDVLTVVCASCGDVGPSPFAQVGVYIAQHYARFHPGISVISWGEHYTAHMAPLRCDVCNDVVELPYWTHSCTPPIHDPKFAIIDHDGLWLLCDHCHGFLRSGQTAAWLKRMWQINVRQTPFLATIPLERKAAVRAVLVEKITLLDERLDDGERNTVESPGPTS